MPLYPMTDWVASPLGALFASAGLSALQGIAYYLFCFGLNAFKKWIDSKV